MNQLLVSAIIAALVLALVYVFMRVMRLEKDVKGLRNRAPPMDLAQAVWGMASDSPHEMAFAPPLHNPDVEMCGEHPPALNECLIEEEFEEEEEELIEALSKPTPDQPPAVESPKEADQPIKDVVAPPVRRPAMRKKKPLAPEE